MKTIKLLHLYFDIMNLYGENANVRFLIRKLEEQDFKVEVDYLSLEDKINFSKYDFIYLGSGTEINQRVVLENIKQYKEDIIKYIDDDKYFLVTGNSIELFGKSISYDDMDELEGLGLFDYYAKQTTPRIIGDQLYETDLIDSPILGFQNHSNELFDVEPNLFKVDKGIGFNKDEDEEGIRKNNFIATYLVGPLLVRNPLLCDLLVKDLCKKFEVKYKEPDTNNVAYKAHDEFINNWYSEE